MTIASTPATSAEPPPAVPAPPQPISPRTPAAHAAAPRADDSEAEASSLLARLRDTRALTLALCEPLSPEDMVVQSMPGASPAKWHLAHTTWFFEAFILEKHAAGYRPFDPRFGFLFNSYYNALGDRHPRAKRGLLTRPTAREVIAYRHAVDNAVRDLIENASEPTAAALRLLIELGIQHEQQHQELLLTDIKHLLAQNPLRPAYRQAPSHAGTPSNLNWIQVAGGVHAIGMDADNEAFAYDNESPRHKIYLEDFQIADRLVTNGEFAAFIADRGYERPELWLDAGHAAVHEQAWTAPLYWRRDGDSWLEFTLAGERPLDPAAPVTHISFFEAEAYARWANARLATEAEWEVAAAALGGPASVGNLLDSSVSDTPPHPLPATSHSGGGTGSGEQRRKSDGNATMRQCFGDCWEWTRSDYNPYPGYQPPPGAIGEYNGKFMCGQFVLRGGSCATPRSHIRATYRNFFAPAARWQFTGIRLARNPA